MTLPIIGEMPEVRYESCQLTEDYLYIKVVNPRLTAEVTPGDIVQAGIIISNSETGQGSVCVQPLVYRLVCSNGMVVNDAKTRRTHLGRASNTEEDFVIYSQETLAADDKAFILKLQDTVRAAINEVQFAQVVDKMRESKGIKLNTANIPSVVKDGQRQLWNYRGGERRRVPASDPGRRLHPFWPRQCRDPIQSGRGEL